MLYRVIAERSEGDLKAIRPSKVSIGVAANKADPDGAGDVQLLEVSPHCVILCSRVHWNKKEKLYFYLIVLKPTKGVHCELIDLLHAFISASFITPTIYANVKNLNRIFELGTRLLLSHSLCLSYYSSYRDSYRKVPQKVLEWRP